MTYQEALRSPTRQVLCKVEFYDKNENIIDEVIDELLDGTISIETKNGIRRTCNLTFENSDGRFLPSEDGLISINNRIKIYTGLVVDGVETYNLRGVFVLGNPRLTSKLSENTITIEAYDKFALLDDTLAGSLTDTYQVNAGELISKAVTDTVFESGFITSTPVIYPTTEVTPYTLTLTPGQNYAELLYKLADMLSWYIFFDNMGNLRFEPPTEQNTQAESWDFSNSDDSEVTYLGSIRSLDWNKVRNYVKVIGDNINGDTKSATASDTYIFSETSIDRIGQRTLVVTDNLIYTDELAQERADYELSKAVQIQESVDMECIPIDILNEDDIVLVTDTQNGLDRARYLIKSINYPLKNGNTMQLKVWNVRSVI